MSSPSGHKARDRHSALAVPFFSSALQYVDDALAVYITSSSSASTSTRSVISSPSSSPFDGTPFRLTSPLLADPAADAGERSGARYQRPRPTDPVLTSDADAAPSRATPRAITVSRRRVRFRSRSFPKPVLSIIHTRRWRRIACASAASSPSSRARTSSSKAIGRLPHLSLPSGQESPPSARRSKPAVSSRPATRRRSAGPAASHRRSAAPCRKPSRGRLAHLLRDDAAGHLTRTTAFVVESHVKGQEQRLTLVDDDSCSRPSCR